MEECFGKGDVRPARCAPSMDALLVHMLQRDPDGNLPHLRHASTQHPSDMDPHPFHGLAETRKRTASIAHDGAMERPSTHGVEPRQRQLDFHRERAGERVAATHGLPKCSRSAMPSPLKNPAITARTPSHFVPHPSGMRWKVAPHWTPSPGDARSSRKVCQRPKRTQRSAHGPQHRTLASEDDYAL